MGNLSIESSASEVNTFTCAPKRTRSVPTKPENVLARSRGGQAGTEPGPCRARGRCRRRRQRSQARPEAYCPVPARSSPPLYMRSGGRNGTDLGRIQAKHAAVDPCARHIGAAMGEIQAKTWVVNPVSG
eukprot:1918309-Rhodomonas_salina.1